MILLDSTALIDILRGRLKVDELVSDVCATTLINIQEVAFGLSLKESIIFNDFIEQFIVLDYNLDCVKEAAKLFRELRSKGIEIPKFDCLIAGSMVVGGVSKILTKDGKHFGRIAGITVVPY